MSNEKISKIATNIKNEIHILSLQGVEVIGDISDPTVAFWLIEPESQKIKPENSIIMEIAAVYIKKSELNKLEEKIPEYFRDSVIRSVLSFSVMDILFPILSNLQLLEVYKELEMPIIRVLSEMEKRGMLADCSSISSVFFEVERKMTGIQNAINEYSYAAGSGPVYLESPQQVSELLFTTLGLKYPRDVNTKSGNKSTKLDILESLQNEHVVPKLIMEHRSLSNMNRNWLKKLFRNMDVKLYHPNYDTFTSNGRISTSNPSLQNLPKSITFHPAGQYNLHQEIASKSIEIGVDGVIAGYQKSARVVCCPKKHLCVKTIPFADENEFSMYVKTSICKIVRLSGI